MSDRWMNTMLDKVQAVSNTDEPSNWKRADWSKIIDEAYLHGFNDGEAVRKVQYIKTEHGRRFKIRRQDLDFNSFNKLCQRLQVRLDAECIDFIGFDVQAYKKTGELFQDPVGLETKEDTCQAVNTLPM